MNEVKKNILRVFFFTQVILVKMSFVLHLFIFQTLHISYSNAFFAPNTAPTTHEIGTITFVCD